MNSQRLLQRMIVLTLVVLFSMACGASQATPTPVPPTATPAPPTSTPPPAAPTYSEILGTYPAGATLCATQANLLDVSGDGALLNGTIEFAGGSSPVGVESGTMSVAGVGESGGAIVKTSSDGAARVGPLGSGAPSEFSFQCYGAKITVKEDVTLGDVAYESGTKLTVDKDLQWVEVSSWN